MSTFEVTLEKVRALSPIDGADRIETGCLEGMDYEFVVKKGEFKVGDIGVYFPVDSIIPEDILEKIGLKGKLSGGKGNRVKTCRFKKQISQGLFIPCHTLDVSVPYGECGCESHKGINLADYFGITKYDYEAASGPQNPDAKGLLPDFLSKFDIESAQKYKETLEAFDNVMVTEKAEGQNFCGGSKEDNSPFLCSRSLELKSEEESTKISDWHFVFKNYDIYKKALKLKFILGAKTIAIYGEQIGRGIQGDYYGLGEVKFLCFDIKVNGEFMKPTDWKSTCEQLEIPMVPILFEGKLSDYLEGKTAVQKSNGFSLINPKKLREGIVFKNINPRQGSERILKIRDPIYLGETGAE